MTNLFSVLVGATLTMSVTDDPRWFGATLILLVAVVIWERTGEE